MQNLPPILQIHNLLLQLLALTLRGRFLTSNVLQLLLTELGDKVRTEQLERGVATSDQEVPNSLSVAVVDEAFTSDVVVGLENVVDLLDVVVGAQKQGFELFDQAVAVVAVDLRGIGFVAFLAAAGYVSAVMQPSYHYLIPVVETGSKVLVHCTGILSTFDLQEEFDMVKSTSVLCSQLFHENHHKLLANNPLRTDVLE